MTEVIALLQGLPGGVILALLFLLIFGPTAILSKTAAEKFGAFGAVARWWRNRPLQKIEQQERQTAAEVTVLMRRIEILEGHIKSIQKSQAQERADWKKQLQHAEHEINEVRRGIHVRDDSIFALYDWSIRARVSALSGGVTLPPIPEISFLSLSSEDPQGEIETGE